MVVDGGISWRITPLGERFLNLWRPVALGTDKRAWIWRFMLTCPRLALNFYSIRVPKGATPFVSTVFGNSPEPQIMNEPKSLYHSPSGAHGTAFTHACNRRRS